MSAVELRSIQDCFEGVIPSVVATLAADGTPNVSYLSQVWLVDETHVALSNQFFSKTMANVRATGRASVLVVDGRAGDQYGLELEWERSVMEGELFEEMSAHLAAISSVHGTDSFMRLKSAEVYRVLECRAIAGARGRVPPPVRPQPGERLGAAARLAAAVAAESDPDAIVDCVMDGLVREFGFAHVMALVPDADGERLTTLASRGYAQSGVGSQVGLGQGAIGIAAKSGRPLRLCDMSRGRRFAQAVLTQAELDAQHLIPLPGLEEPLSQIAVPMTAQGRLAGVLFAEDAERFRFGREDQDALALVGTQLAASLRLAELQAASPAPARPTQPVAAAAGGGFRLKHYPFDDSVFLDDEYIIKGVPGRLLVHFVQTYLAEGRRSFTNREVRLDPRLKLPDLKDNLETRLILLRRRLEERGAPVRLVRPGRGQIELELNGEPVLETA